MTYPISGCAFIRDNQTGAFCLWESMASMLPFVSEFVVMDLGSTDGTLEKLEELSRRNPKVKLVRGSFPVIDAGAFATLANDLVAMCSYDNVWYCQADEVPHQDLLRRLDRKLAEGADDLAFWRVQLSHNWQSPKWLPHIVHRIGRKGPRFSFVGDGMNSSRYMEPPICSDYGGEYFSQWSEMWKTQGIKGLAPYMNQMILDVSLLGGFRDAIPDRRYLHHKFWHEAPTIPYSEYNVQPVPWYTRDEWLRIARADERWTRTDTPFDIPHIMKWHLGRTTYQLRKDLFEALCEDDTRSMIGL